MGGTGKSSIIIFSALFSFGILANPIVDDICDQVIPFALNNGIQVSDRDLYHCHTVLKLKAGEAKVYSNNHDWKYLVDRGIAYVCHAHEKDGKRVTDNFNIFHKDGQTSFWGASYPVVENDVLEKFSLPKDQFAITWTNIYFYPESSPLCQWVSEPYFRKCGGIPVCIGLESDEFDRKSKAFEQALLPPVEDGLTN